MPIYKVTLQRFRKFTELTVNANSAIEAKVKAVKMMKWDYLTVYCKAVEIATDEEIYRYE